MNLLRIALPVALSFATFIAHAEPKTVTLSVPGMSCELCPITLKKAISKVRGVTKVEASYQTRQAVVTFDDAITALDALTKATANAGYPSAVKR